MNLMDAFSREDCVEVTISQLYDLVKEAGRADLFRNGVKNRIPYAHILCVMDGDSSALEIEKPVIWHNAKTEPPKSPGLYYGKKDDTNSMWACNYMDGEWTLNALPTQKMDIVQWAEYTAFSDDGDGLDTS